VVLALIAHGPHPRVASPFVDGKCPRNSIVEKFLAGKNSWKKVEDVKF
jgi:hypothetical protein